MASSRVEPDRSTLPTLTPGRMRLLYEPEKEKATTMKSASTPITPAAKARMNPAPWRSRGADREPPSQSRGTVKWLLAREKAETPSFEGSACAALAGVALG